MFPFVRTDSGWIWAHAYSVDPESSTFTVECSAETRGGLGFDTMPPQDCLGVLEKIFERQRDGHQLICYGALPRYPQKPVDERRITRGKRPQPADNRSFPVHIMWTQENLKMNCRRPLRNAEAGSNNGSAAGNGATRGNPGTRGGPGNRGFTRVPCTGGRRAP